MLDSSFVIDLLDEITRQREGPARDWLRRNGRARIFITPVTVAEVLEGADDPVAARAYLAQFSWHGIHARHAEIVARLQRGSGRRLGENDAWQCAIAESIGARLVGHDRAFARLSALYEDHRPGSSSSR